MKKNMTESPTREAGILCWTKKNRNLIWKKKWRNRDVDGCKLSARLMKTDHDSRWPPSLLRMQMRCALMDDRKTILINRTREMDRSSTANRSHRPPNPRCVLFFVSLPELKKKEKEKRTKKKWKREKRRKEEKRGGKKRESCPPFTAGLIDWSMGCDSVAMTAVSSAIRYDCCCWWVPWFFFLWLQLGLKTRVRSPRPITCWPFSLDRRCRTSRPSRASRASGRRPSGEAARPKTPRLICIQRKPTPCR